MTGTEKTVRVIPTREDLAAGFHAVLNSVARERRYIGFVAAPPLDEIRKFVGQIARGDIGVQMLAVTDKDLVVGWCDIARNPHEGFRHVGRLGMGLLPEYRRRGLGRQLVEQTVAAARAQRMERIELEVFASNAGAVEFYRKLGFVIEGAKRRARKLDGAYDDLVQMALV